jgi:hypothetical protein
MWRNEDRSCNECLKTITDSGFVNPEPELHFHNTPDQPCFWLWIKKQLPNVVKPKTTQKGDKKQIPPAP